MTGKSAGCPTFPVLTGGGEASRPYNKYLYYPEATPCACLSAGMGVVLHSANALFSAVCLILSLSTCPAFSIFLMSTVTLSIWPVNLCGAGIP